MRVYHGSYTEIEMIDLSFCVVGKDFGQGFYVTKLREQAEFFGKKENTMVHQTHTPNLPKKGLNFTKNHGKRYTKC